MTTQEYVASIVSWEVESDTDAEYESSTEGKERHELSAM